MIKLADKMKKPLILLLLLFAVFALVGCEEIPDEPPIINEKVKYINGVNEISENKINEKIEFVLYETEEYQKLDLNPYDYRDFKIIGTFKTPSGDEKDIYAFWFQDFNLKFDDKYLTPPSGISGVASQNPNELQGLETAVSIGDPHFYLRYLSNELGEHDLRINIYLNNKVVQTINHQFIVNEGDRESKGVLLVEPVHQRNFIFENGDTFIPIGQNTSWYTSSTRKTEDYRIWFSKMHENSANFSRIWMGTWSFALHSGSEFDNFDSRQAQAYRLDKVFDFADEYEIYFLLAFINHGQFSDKVNPQWNLNPWNKANGGILNRPQQFFTDNDAIEIYKQQVTYIISRWGYSDKVIWELWNEVDWTDNFNTMAVSVWHSNIGQFIKEIDAYQHMVTTSYKGNLGLAYNSQYIDFVNPHDYGYSNVNVMQRLVPNIDTIFRNYGKPVLTSEIGINYENGRNNYEADPTGISIKQSQWAGMMGGGAGGAMNWWWDSYVHPNDLYYRFKGAGEFAKNLNMVGDSYELLQKLSGVTLNNDNSALIGYKIDNRVYGYLYDKNWKYNYLNISNKNVKTVIPVNNGTYLLSIYDTDTGELIEELEVVITNKEFTYTFSFKEDKAFILKEKK